MSVNAITNIDVKDKTVLLRLDLNVPVQDGIVTDTTRIDRVKDTVLELSKRGAKTLILAHYGRPKGEKDDEYSLQFLPKTLEIQWGIPVSFCSDCIGIEAKEAVAKLQSGEVCLLENVRFYKGEEKNDPAFAKELAALGDLYVNDAFSAAHRAHASTEGLAHILPAYAGNALLSELEALEKALEKPERPVAAIIGGAKVSTKLSLISNLIPKMDMVVLGGGMANTFFLAQGLKIGKSLAEPDMLDEARNIIELAKKHGCALILPSDGLMAKEFKQDASFRASPVTAIEEDEMMLDIGPISIEDIQTKLGKAKTVLWNGPMGAFEIVPFDQGTNAIAQFVAQKTTEGEVISIAGGGDTVSALANAKADEQFTYLSTAGGAFLEWLEGKTLPGIAALKKYKNAA